MSLIFPPDLFIIFPSWPCCSAFAAIMKYLGLVIYKQQNIIALPPVLEAVKSKLKVPTELASGGWLFLCVCTETVFSWVFCPGTLTLFVEEGP